MTLTVVTSDQSFFEAHNSDLRKTGKIQPTCAHIIKTAHSLYRGLRSGHVLLVPPKHRKPSNV